MDINNKFDVAVVGSGPAGIVVAYELAKQGKRVAILEANTLASDSFSKIDVSGDFFHPPGDKYRKFLPGGSSTAWAGRSVIFDKQDFEGDSGKLWPIPYSELSKFYDAALDTLDCNCHFPKDFERMDRLTGELIDIDNENFDFSYDVYSPPTNVFLKYKESLDMLGVVFLSDHVLTHCIESVDNDQGVVLSGHSKSGLFCISADKAVLACGGLEVTRLLLNWRKKGEYEISDSLGKGYMTHYAGTLGSFEYQAHPKSYGYGKINKTFIRKKYLLKKRKESDISFTARIHFPDINNPIHKSGILSFLFLSRKLVGYEYSLRLSDNSSLSYFAHIKNIFREPFATFSHVAMLLYGRFFAKSKIPPLVKPVSKYFNLDIHCEQSPSDDSCISLSSSKDCFGLNNIEVSWRPCQSDLDNLSENIRELVSCIGEKCESYEKLSPDQIKDDILRHGAFGGHFIGTAKMGRDPDTSVVDSDLKLHSSSKVYVLSSAVFPTSSHANPTLTIVALAHRLAKHILREEYD